ncbi:TolC family protein [Butyrivibrio sp. AE3004]|uniref:TolC family protein n=1 Tax=Butyrivibrio sp. AE3004 TaxID=1506994 RepID=UPI00049469C2|nr:TolC family protein [Butyrivibrio sp. AE3004]
MRELHEKLNIGIRMWLAVVTVCTFMTSMCPSSTALVAHAEIPTKKVLTLKACRNLAIQNSTDYESAEMAIESKKAAYESAVKAINLKKLSMAQFRWSPLLSFKFPTSPDFSEASEFTYKPISIQYEIQIAEHKLQDKTYEIAEKVNNLFVEIVVLQESLAFNERRLEVLKTGLARNEKKLLIGQANKSDVEKLQKKVETVTGKIAADKRNYEANLKKLSNMLGLDVTTGYSFEKPFVEATLERSKLDALIEYTEDRDETYYEACIAEATARAELMINKGLMANKYGGDYNLIAGYVNAAINGDKINKKTFMASYKSFIKKIDSYWEGSKRIIFFKIPRLWFKGDMDGSRYIDDDPYVLYQNTLDYATALNEKKAAKEELDQSVIDTFNNYVSVKNSYKQYLKDVDNAEKNLKKDEIKNRMGELTFDEYDSEMESYEELQNSMFDAMKLYTTTLYSFDRLTCGGISGLLSGTDADLKTAVVGESYVEKNELQGAYYTLRSIIQKQEFELSLMIPEDFDIDITDYELWVDNILIGERTPKDKKLRHLTLTVDNVSQAKIRLYNGDTFVDDCIIDPSTESGPLTITSGFDIKKVESDQLGTYEVNISETTGIVELSFKMIDSDIKSFKVLTEDGKPLGGDTPVDIKKSLKYISIIQESLSDLTIEFYDAGGALINKGRLVEASSTVIKKEDE